MMAVLENMAEATGVIHLKFGGDISNSANGGDRIDLYFQQRKGYQAIIGWQ